MNAKRNRIEIINDMLSIIRDKGDTVKPTQIMYKANLSHEMLSTYIKELLTKEFIIEKKDKNERKTYTLTDKGFNFLKDYKMMQGFIGSYDLNE